MSICFITIRLFILAITIISLCNLVHGARVLMFVSVNGHLVNTRVDPLTNPDCCSGHVHSVSGSASFSAGITIDDVIHNGNWRDDDNVNQTTSNITPNKSMYWAPALYIRNPNDNTYHTAPSFSRAYYRLSFQGSDYEGKDEEVIPIINPYPPFLRLIAGDASRREYWDVTDVHDNIRWTTRDNRETTDSINNGDWKYLQPPFDISDVPQLEMNINFPECLQVENGVPLTESPDWRSHAAYLDDNLRCPATHPYHIPTLNLEVRYKLDELRLMLDQSGQDGTSIVNNVENWILSSGDTTGAGAHADFVSGWPTDLIDHAIQKCRKIGTTQKSKNSFSVECDLWKYYDDRGVTTPLMEDKQIDYTEEVPNEVVEPTVTSLPNLSSSCSLTTCSTGPTTPLPTPAPTTPGPTTSLSPSALPTSSKSPTASPTCVACTKRQGGETCIKNGGGTECCSNSCIRQSGNNYVCAAYTETCVGPTTPTTPEPTSAPVPSTPEPTRAIMGMMRKLRR